ncbi:MAG: YkvA family protein [Pseudomonadaceae bacterium]|nr:YkvA family protein [Pseudomonadaceae bacterium]
MKKLPANSGDEQQDVPAGYSREETRARRLINEPGRLASKLHSASEKLDGVTSRSSKFATVRAELATLISLVRAWAAGDYRQISTASIVSIVAGIIYFLNPLDVVPDFIFGFGLLDDATVLAFVINRVSSELSQYRDWVRQRDGANEDPAGEPDGDPDA